MSIAIRRSAFYGKRTRRYIPQELLSKALQPRVPGSAARRKFVNYATDRNQSAATAWQDQTRIYHPPSQVAPSVHREGGRRGPAPSVLQRFLHPELLRSRDASRRLLPGSRWSVATLGATCSLSSKGATKNKSSSKGTKKRGRSGNSGGKSNSAAETAEPVLTFHGVTKQLPGGRELFKDASLSFVRGAKVGVLGVNGSGKSTVLKILAGQGEYSDQALSCATKQRVMSISVQFIAALDQRFSFATRRPLVRRTGRCRS